jgi:hypothetical protein
LGFTAGGATRGGAQAACFEDGKLLALPCFLHSTEELPASEWNNRMLQEHNLGFNTVLLIQLDHGSVEKVRNQSHLLSNQITQHEHNLGFILVCRPVRIQFFEFVCYYI